MKRRTLLKGITAGAIGVGFGLFPRLARAAWGDIDPQVWPAGVTPATKVLEIYLWGGMAPWESFYYSSAVGSTTRGFDTDVGALVWNTGVCSGTPAGLVTQFLANDLNGAGKSIHLGPFAKPLWRTDIAAKIRVVCLYHDLTPHEAAIPYALSGQRLGHADATGLGAPMQRRARALDVSHTHPLPFSYCMLTAFGISQPMLSTIDAVGNHPGDSKPITLPIGPGTAAFISNLNRVVPANADALLANYSAQYAARLTRPAASGPARSRAYQDFASSTAGLASAPQLSTLLTSAPLSVTAAQACARDAAAFENGIHLSSTALQAAAYLLNHPDTTKRANYVCIVDGGLHDAGDGQLPYDVHDFGDSRGQAMRTGSNLWETLSALAGIIRAPADPPSSTKIDLADTLIVIKTEFGRTPFRSTGGIPTPASIGRDHWPDGYVGVLIGGPIQAAGVAGSIGDGTGNMGTQGRADQATSYQPQDFQAAALLAGGIDPFADGNLPLGNLSPNLQTGTHTASMINLRQQILGVP